MITRRGLVTAALGGAAAGAVVPGTAMAAPTGLGENIRDHGAVGDGITDDTAAIQAAAAAAGDGAVIVPPGRYRHTQTITHHTVLGTGKRDECVLLYGGAGTAWGSPTPEARTHHRRLENVSVVTPAATDLGLDGIVPPPAEPTGDIGLDFSSMSRSHVQNVLVAGFRTGVRVRSGANGTAGAYYNRLLDVRVGGCDTGVLLTSRANENSFYGCAFNGCGVGARIDSGDHNLFHHCAIEAFTSAGVIIEGTGDDNKVMDCRFEAPAGRTAIRVAAAMRGTLLHGNALFTGTVYDVQSADVTIMDARRPHLALRSADYTGALVVAERSSSTSAALVVAKDKQTGSGQPTVFQGELATKNGKFFAGRRTDLGYDITWITGYGTIRPLSVPTVADLPPAGGWNTNTLAVVRAPTVRLYLSNGTAWNPV